MQYNIKVTCEATVTETWRLDWPHDGEPTVDEIDEMLSGGDSALTHVRDSVSDEHDREVLSIAPVRYSFA